MGMTPEDHVLDLAKSYLAIETESDRAKRMSGQQACTKRFLELKATGHPVHLLPSLLEAERLKNWAEAANDKTLPISDKTLSLSRLSRLISEQNWEEENYTSTKAYILCCAAQVSYCILADQEGEALGTASVVLSELQESLHNPSDIDPDPLFAALQEAGIAVEFFQTVSFTYVMFRVQTVVLVAVRCTVASDISDWINGLHAQPRLASKKATYHRGFLNEANAGLDEIMKRTRARRVPVWITGHSLGAAVAAIINQRNVTGGCYAFGCPRFANAAGVAKREPFAHVRSGDLVPHLPSQSGYADASTNTIKLGPEEQADWAGETTQTWREQIRPRLLKQHAIEGYRADIAKLMDPSYPDAALADRLHDLLQARPNSDPLAATPEL